MAQQAKRTDVIEAALAAAFGNRDNMVCLPKAATAGDPLHSVETQAGFARGASGAFQCGVCSQGINPAYGTPTAVTRKDLVAKITGVGSQTPLVYAVVAAEGAAAFGEDLKLAPAAERQAIWSFGKIFATGTSTRQFA